MIPARAIAAQIEAPGYRPLTAVAIYLEHGKGIGSPNLQHMETVGLFLEAQGDHVPFIAGGDYQADPGEVARLGFAQRTSASLVASRNPRGTCRSSTSTSEIDFFFIRNELTPGLRSVEVVEGAGTAPHLPVRVTFHPRLTSARSLVLRRPPRMGTERIFGPLPRPPCWDEVRHSTASLLRELRDPEFAMSDAFRENYSAAYEAWSDVAEQEIIDATSHEVQVTKWVSADALLYWYGDRCRRNARLPLLNTRCSSTGGGR